MINCFADGTFDDDETGSRPNRVENVKLDFWPGLLLFLFLFLLTLDHRINAFLLFFL